jgi:hypothetical protein
MCARPSRSCSRPSSTETRRGAFVAFRQHLADRIYPASKVDPQLSFTEEPGAPLLAVAAAGRQEEDDA